jgi:glycosyltransferase involved in cell wall biosynthesis
MRKEIKNLLKEERFDLIILSGEYNIGAINGLETPPIIVDMCDAKSERVRKRIASVKSFIWKWTLRVKLWETQNIERRIFRKSACIVCASDRDQRIVPAASRDRSFVVSNGVDTGYWRRQSSTLGHHTLIFTGAMHFPPNSDTALYLVNEILPRVREKIPDVELLIVGHSPGEKLIEASKQPGVTVTGYVDDMRPYLEKATVFVSPLRFGSGIQNKLLEAMAMGLPIVTSSVAGDGVRVDGMEPPFLIADDIDTFVRYTIGLLRQYDANPTPAQNAREYVETHFTWDRNAQRLNEILQAVK